MADSERVAAKDATAEEENEASPLPKKTEAETAAGSKPSPRPASTEAEPTGAADAETHEDEAVGRGETTDDFKMAVSHHLSWVGKLRDFCEAVFHYFFVGCTSLLGLAVLFLLPLTLLACVAFLFGVPAFLVHRWFGEPGHYVTPLTVLVTIFWAGYFVTHGWPRLRRWLEGLFARCKPALTWIGRTLGRFSDEGDEEERPESRSRTSNPPAGSR